MLAGPASHITSGTSRARFTLEGVIPPRRIPLTYRITLALTALAMALLPLLYFALIVLTGWGVYLYATHGTAIFGMPSGGWIKLMLYVAPLFAGVSLIIFMIKPLFAESNERAEPVTLDLDTEPHLRALIAAICDQVGAPIPVQIDVDCRVNASASLRRGLLSLGQKDLVLTIGLPLASSLTARQLAGVLAHEFGHFAQGAGMAFSYIIRSINGWFARVVFERDSWDDQLAEWESSAGSRTRLVLWLARAAIWLSRKILHGLMLAGHAIACLQLRQMEFDADYYMTHVAGSEAFVETSRELSRLSVTSQSVFAELGDLWRQQRLVDDFPGFVALRRGQLTPEATAKIDAEHFGIKTKWSDTHPSDLARTVHAKALALPGVFRGDGPATALFTDFTGLCRDATQHFYGAHLNLTFDESALVPVVTAARRGDEANAADVARIRLVGTVLNLTRPLVWSETDFLPASYDAPAEPAVIAGQLATFRAELARHRESAEATEKKYILLRDERSNVHAAHGLLSVGINVNPATFDLAASDPASAERRRSDLDECLAATASELAPFETAVAGWVRAVVVAARNPALGSRLPGELAERIDRTARSLAALAPWFRAFPNWVCEQNLLASFAANEVPFTNHDRFNLALKTQRDKTRAIVTQAASLAGNTPYPFSDITGASTVTLVLNRALEGVLGDGRVLVTLRTVTNYYFRLLGQIAAQGEELERALQSMSAA